jgi:hypothetical protein
MKAPSAGRLLVFLINLEKASRLAGGFGDRLLAIGVRRLRDLCGAAARLRHNAVHRTSGIPNFDHTAASPMNAKIIQGLRLIVPPVAPSKSHMLHVEFGSWPREDFSTRRARRNILKKLRISELRSLLACRT